MNQKVQAKAERIRSCENRETQYSQNTTFKKETKIFRKHGCEEYRGQRTSLYGRSRYEEKKHRIMKEQNG
jgi:hypothetical protein